MRESSVYNGSTADAKFLLNENRILNYDALRQERKFDCVVTRRCRSRLWYTLKDSWQSVADIRSCYQRDYDSNSVTTHRRSLNEWDCHAYWQGCWELCNYLCKSIDSISRNCCIRFSTSSVRWTFVHCARQAEKKEADNLSRSIITRQPSLRHTKIIQFAQWKQIFIVITKRLHTLMLQWWWGEAQRHWREEQRAEIYKRGREQTEREDETSVAIIM